MRNIYAFICEFACLLVVSAGLGTPAAGAAGTGCEPAQLATKYPALVGKTIKIGQDGESVPFSMRDPKDLSKLIGLDVDLSRAAFECLGVPTTFVVGAWAGLIPAGMSGQIDVMWDSLLYTPERAKRLDFVVYMNSATGMLVAKGNPKKIHALGDLCGLSATATLGTTQEAMLREASTSCVGGGKSTITIVTATDISSGLRLVQNGRADLVSLNKFVGDNMVASSPTTVESAFDIVTGAKLAVGIGKGNPDLLRAIKDAIAILRANGTEKTIYERYNVDYSLTTDPSVLTE